MDNQILNNLEFLPFFFHALSDPIRLNILESIGNQEICVGDLCKVLNLKQPKLSFHLKILRDSGFVNTRQDGRWIYYRLNKSRFEVLKQYIAKYQHNSLEQNFYQENIIA
ncbi:ArsR/SmtB family transcription factor [Geminocystis sp.]|uniref:ArsR/SmtB family transcription factor n=1 Tax=Geminocystis sp. TaxID=2664100 RepID=UPI0035933AA4